MSNSYCSAQKAIAVFGDGLILINYCPIVIALHRKRSLCLAMIDNQFNYCPIVIALHRKRSLCLAMIDNQFNYCPIVIALAIKPQSFYR
ncbi:MAG: hypothetical protein SWX82_18835 [Cyanobacteriota bacterium]|nr:hypothetical protein [Cyanobacteriota bacterium]